MKSQFFKLYFGLIASALFAVIVLQSIFLGIWGDAQDKLFSQQFEAYRKLAITLTDRPQQQISHMHALAKEMGAELSVAEEDELFEKELQLLREKGVLVVNSDEALSYFLIPKDSKIYRFQYRENHPLLDQLSLSTDLTLIAVFIALGLVLGAWVYFLNAKLVALNKAAERLASGDLGARAPKAKNQQVGQLNLSFNLMAERIEKLIESHKQLSNAIAHELRSPIFRLQCQLDMLADEHSAETRAKYIKGLDEDVKELSYLVEELLQHAKMENAQYRIQREPQEIVTWLLQSLQGLQLESEIVIRYSHSEEACQYSFDCALMQRAVQNIIRNAFRYAKELIEVSLQSDGQAIFIHFDDDDDGEGIPEDQREAIFHPFHRIDSARSRNSEEYGGYGLGLAIVRQAIELHGGEVNLSESPSGGARFSFYLPLK
ncbi:ATP-binding protein [uncultured Pseudoteredinibacter sp.]|uniref:ATP-binding protein n=1 Tax=uncultured Pseudoteredinibacter sp. TaxID=1641701 RepID=UPI00262C6FA7|nr:ATP-binding protein [uncultured Pseudoteredinibacter sp.]